MSAFTPRLFATRFAASVFALSLVAGCATPPPADDKEAVAEWEQTNDPFEPANRAIFEFNQAVDKALLKPLAQAYRAVVPQFGRDRVRDFVTNLRAPIVFANDLLQGEPDRAVETAMRFAFNTSFGIGGLFDLSTEAGIPFHDEDFGQTFAVWGLPEGPYIVLPILGPSNPRDTGGLVTEWVSDPINLYFHNTDRDWAIWSRTGMAGVDKREYYLDPLDEIERTSLDFYSSLRALYRQRRDADIRNDKIVDKVPAPRVSAAGR